MLVKPFHETSSGDVFVLLGIAAGCCGCFVGAVFFTGCPCQKIKKVNWATIPHECCKCDPKNICIQLGIKSPLAVGCFVCATILKKEIHALERSTTHP